ncbi:MAG: hypothetical protein GTO22_19485 [Gemmatimonadales bacterium]|nr:hypothetical protein [Gemmatimonadales bacterium]
MNVVLAVLVVLFLLVLPPAWFIHRKYSRLLRDDHYLELLRLLPGLKEAALARVGETMQPPDDARFALTQRGLAVVYSIEVSASGYLHHLSCSYRGGPMAFAAGGRFLYVMMGALGSLGDLKAVAHTRAGITHGVFELSELQQRAYEDRIVAVPKPEHVPRLKEAATEWLHALRARGELLQSEEELLNQVGAA